MPCGISEIVGIIGTAVATGGAVAKMASSSDKRPSLGGPSTLGSTASASLAQIFANRPLSENPGLTQPAVTGQNVPDIGMIRQNVDTIGQRLGINTKRV